MRPGHNRSRSPSHHSRLPRPPTPEMSHSPIAMSSSPTRPTTASIARSMEPNKVTPLGKIPIPVARYRQPTTAPRPMTAVSDATRITRSLPTMESCPKSARSVNRLRDILPTPPNTGEATWDAPLDDDASVASEHPPTSGAERTAQLQEFATVCDDLAT